MKTLLYILLAIPAVVSSGYWLVSAVTTGLFLRRKPKLAADAKGSSPKVSILKPVYGLERGAEENFRTFLEQDYPDYEVIFGVQRDDDPVLPVVKKLVGKYPGRARYVVDSHAVGPNGKINNLVNCYHAASGEIIVISDADTRVGPSYLKIITGPLADPETGAVSTLYKAADALTIPEKLELLSFNTEFIPNVCFASLFGFGDACLGASIALKRVILDRIGGFEPLAHYLVEDFEMGRRIGELGLGVSIIPYVADTTVDLAGYRTWFEHQIYWDQNTRAAKPAAFAWTILLKGIPAALLLWIVSGFQSWALAFLGTVIGIRLLTAGIILGTLRDQTGLKALPMLPLRDLAALATWFLSLTRNHTTWKDRLFRLEAGKLVEVGRIPDRASASPASSPAASVNPAGSERA